MTDIQFKVDKKQFKSDLDWAINSLSKDQHTDKKRTTFFECFKGFAAAAATALLGIGQLELFWSDKVFQLLAILVTASLTIVTAWDNLFKHKSLWLQAAAAANQFRRLQSDFVHAELTESLTPELLVEFYDRYNRIWDKRNEAWMSLREGAT